VAVNVEMRYPVETEQKGTELSGVILKGVPRQNTNEKMSPFVIPIRINQNIEYDKENILWKHDNSKSYQAKTLLANFPTEIAHISKFLTTKRSILLR
jgi:hypothetical protein